MLIKCKECGKEISSQADFCPHCGYKNEKTVTCPYCDWDTGKTYLELQKSQINGNIEICKKCGEEVLVTTPNEELVYKKRMQEQANTPHCPSCNSTNVEKISTGKKIFGGAMFGLFSSDVRNTMHCKNCGYKW